MTAALFHVAVLERYDAAPSLDEVTQFIQETAASLFREKRELLRHWFLLVRPSATLELLILHPMSDRPGPDLPDAIRDIARARGARAAWTVAETWYSGRAYTDRSAYQYGALSTQPERYPDRQEAVLLIRESVDTQPIHRLWLARIDRSHGRPKLGPWEERMTLNSTGLAMHLLPPEAYGRSGDA